MCEAFSVLIRLIPPSSRQAEQAYLKENKSMHLERHSIERVGWLRAAVLGANDGIVSTASLVLGVASANTGSSGVLLAGIAGLVAGAMSMAAGNMFPSHLRPTRKTRLSLRKKGTGNRLSGRSTRADFTLCATRTRARACPKVAEQLMVKDALDTHAREELGLTDTNSARPLQAAVFSALSFSAGATLPLVVAWLSPATLVFLCYSLLPFSLAALGYISSIVSRASPVRAIGRITFWSTLAMLSSMGIGHLAGQVLF
jgi:VIT1/CCC1 family predicted Fe2+/Mn2+ transporter